MTKTQILLLLSFYFFTFFHTLLPQISRRATNVSCSFECCVSQRCRLALLQIFISYITHHVNCCQSAQSCYPPSRPVPSSWVTVLCMSPSLDECNKPRDFRILHTWLPHKQRGCTKRHVFSTNSFVEQFIATV